MTAIPLSLTLLCVFVSVALISGLAARSFLSRGDAGRRRLREADGPARPSVLPEILSVSVQAQEGDWSGVPRVFRRSTAEMGRLRMKMIRAGYDYEAAPVVYVLAERIAPVVFGVLPLFFLAPPLAWGAAAAAAFVAYATPGFLLSRRLATRRREIDNGLPDALDLLVVCIEAGSGVDQAIAKTADELAIAYPALADELRLLTMEVRAGKSRLEAFKNLAQRTKVDDVRALVAMLIQTDRFGTSIGQALRTHSEISRTKRRQRAEEQAEKIGVKLVFPLVLCFFPAFFIVVLGPAVIEFVRSFSLR